MLARLRALGSPRQWMQDCFAAFTLIALVVLAFWLLGLYDLRR